MDKFEQEKAENSQFVGAQEAIIAAVSEEFRKREDRHIKELLFKTDYGRQFDRVRELSAQLTDAIELLARLNEDINPSDLGHHERLELEEYRRNDPDFITKQLNKKNNG